MIKMIYKATCDRCPNRGAYDVLDMGKELSLEGETVLRDFMRRLTKLGWARVAGHDLCPACVKDAFVEDAPTKKAGKPRKLSKTAREALAQRRIDEEREEA
jgi:hypothetical protein